MRFWKRVDGENKTTTVESYSHSQDVNGAIEILESEYDAYIASLPKTPPKDYRSLFGAASTTDAKIDVIADMLKILP